MNSFGRVFRIHIFGESHGAVVGVNIDGCPAGVPIALEDFETDINRRKAGASGTTPRIEEDIPEIISGVFNGFSTGAPITLIFPNKNIQSKDYELIRSTPRPSHADFVLDKKYAGFNDYRGGGHSSGRLTLAIVAAGVIAKKILSPLEVKAYLKEAGGIADIGKAIEAAIANQDSIGGLVACTVNGLPLGLGEPFFDSLESVISHIIFAIPAIKGISFGAGFEAARMTGSMHNDTIIDDRGSTKTNHAGGINGGISNGNDLYFEVVVKPTSSTPREQDTWNAKTKSIEPFTIKGRHDLCVALRVPVVVEAATAIALADFKLLYNSF
jgi:chorismate synthase